MIPKISIILKYLNYGAIFSTIQSDVGRMLFSDVPGKQIKVFFSFCPLIYVSVASFLWVIGNQNSPGCDGVPSGAILFAHVIFLSRNELK